MGRRAVILHSSFCILPSREPLAGAAPVRSPYKEDLQAAAERQRWWPARVTLHVQRIKSPLHHFNACRPERWCSRQDSHLHWRRPQRRVSSVGLRERLAQGQDWILQPVLLRQDRVTKAIRRLLHGGRNGRSLRCRPGNGRLMKPAGALARLRSPKMEPPPGVAPS
jgi:hypothetical protein